MGDARSGTLGSSMGFPRSRVIAGTDGIGPSKVTLHFRSLVRALPRCDSNVAGRSCEQGTDCMELDGGMLDQRSQRCRARDEVSVCDAPPPICAAGLASQTAG